MRTENNFHQEVRCEIKVTPGVCIKKEVLGATVKVKF